MKPRPIGCEMKIRLKAAIWLFLSVFFFASCATLEENHKQEYGILKAAVMFSSDKVIGEYGDQIPADFDSNRFMELVGDKIPEEYLDALKKHKLEVEPHGWYYLIKAYQDGSLILFDYSCTIELDGPVLDSPEIFDLTNIEKYNRCK